MKNQSIHLSVNCKVHAILSTTHQKTPPQLVPSLNKSWTTIQNNGAWKRTIDVYMSWIFRHCC